MILGVVGLSILFSGCSKTATAGFGKNLIYAQNLQYTKVGKIIQNNEVEFLANITYLNSADSSKWNNGKQNFLVGTYITNQQNITYKATLNEQLPVSTQDVKKDSKMYKNIALLNRWADYKIISFNDINGTNINLTYSSSQENTTSLSFIKE